MPSEGIVVTSISIEHPKGYGGHEFEYQQQHDLFACVHCGRFEVVVRDPVTGDIEPCAGPAEASVRVVAPPAVVERFVEWLRSQGEGSGVELVDVSKPHKRRTGDDVSVYVKVVLR